MRPPLSAALALAALAVAGCGPPAPRPPPPHASVDRPLVIAHRGASAYRPEHTLAAYALAVEMGADVIEPDLVRTRDGALICRHENELSTTTDVASHPAFADRRAVKTIDGREVEGWFSEDFTLAEIRTLRAVERIPALRPANAAYDGQHGIPTLDDVIALAQRLGTERGRPVGLYPETKHPTYFRALGLPLEEPLVEALHAAGYRDAAAPVFLQAFEVETLRRLRPKTQLRLILLAAPGERPFDGEASGDARTFEDWLTPAGLAELAAFADGVGVAKDLVLPRDAEGRIGTPSALVGDAHAAGLVVHVWTVRPESAFLPVGLRAASGEASSRGDVAAEVRALAAAGVDGLFCDAPDLCLAALAGARRQP